MEIIIIHCMSMINRISPSFQLLYPNSIFQLKILTEETPHSIAPKYSLIVLIHVKPLLITIHITISKISLLIREDSNETFPNKMISTNTIIRPKKSFIWNTIPIRSVESLHMYLLLEIKDKFYRTLDIFNIVISASKCSMDLFVR